jgi:hypothetical protein
MADDSLTAALDEIRGLVAARDDLMGRMPVGITEFNAAQDALAEHTPRLLAALDAVLKATEAPGILEDRGLPGDGEAVRRAVREAITRALTGEEKPDG